MQPSSWTPSFPCISQFADPKHWSSDSLDAEGVWAQDKATSGPEIHEAASVELVRLCSANLGRVQEQMARVDTARFARLKGTARVEYDPDRLSTVKRYLHGEMLALRFLAELAMAAAEKPE